MSVKRKAAHASILNMDTPDPKRRRGVPPSPGGTVETPEKTSQVALEFLAKLKSSQDKQYVIWQEMGRYGKLKSQLTSDCSGSHISKHFETLPDRDEYPDYYQKIELPISITLIEERLQNLEYATMEQVEADLKRMIKNAKTYNEKTAEAYNDAEKIRKMMSNSMKTLNPIYSIDPGRSVDPTPLPSERGRYVPSAPAPPTPATPATPLPAATQTPGSGRPKRSLTLNGPRNPAKEDPTAADQTSDDGSFAGKSFQDAQELLIEELINLQDEQGNLISATFLDKPARSLKDYYETIKRPQSLRIIRKQVQGWTSIRTPSTGISNYKTWPDFEDDVSLIWRNAREYNELSSEIVQLANRIEAHFKKRVAEAKAVIPDPAPPKIKLKMTAKSPDPPTPKLTLNGPKPSVDVAVDEGSLRRQQEAVRAATSATPIRRPSSSAVPEALPVVPVAVASATVTPSGLPPSGDAVVHNNGQAPQAPMGVPQRPYVNGNAPVAGMAPPATRPTLNVQQPPVYGHATGVQELVTQRFRAKGKTAADGLLGDVILESHPQIVNLDPEHKFEITVNPSDMYVQQSFTFHVSHQHLWVQLHTIKKKPELLRQTHIYCIVDGKKTPEASSPREDELVFNIPLSPGVMTRIELHAIGNHIRGAPKQGSPDTEFERVQFIVLREYDPVDINTY